jgi:hypothetical protein
MWWLLTEALLSRSLCGGNLLVAHVVENGELRR